ncbi:MAG: VacJ family lipoprotein [Puniceicoccaceae bacterium]|nr:MAG: VacJ family lipoprotein [Puniceicoccaceae bacterium]
MKIWGKHCTFNYSVSFIVAISIMISPLGAEEFSEKELADVWEDKAADFDYELEDWGISERTSVDPFEMTNRSVFKLNDIFYEMVLNPVQDLYQSCTTVELRQSLKNFFHNLKFPIRFVSNTLQFKYKQAYYESLKFGLNTTVGIFGFARPSDHFEFLREIPEEDFGQVLAFWGIKEGPYLVVPFLGPSSMRDLPAKFFEPVINPFEAPVGLWDDVDWQWLFYFNSLELVVISSEQIPAYQTLKATSIDPYLALRSSYRQMRRRAIQE